MANGTGRTGPPIACNVRGMKVFISWSGQKSRDVAVALRDWLPQVINDVQPFVSSKDIYAGARWQMEIAEQLETTNFGLVCVTKENQRSPWLNFEAGALAKAVDASRLVPLAIDLKPSDIEIPLGQFQGQPATEAGVGDILSSINACLPSPLGDALLDKAVKMWWPELKAALDEVELSNTVSSASAGRAGRSDRELLEETLNTVRSFARTRPAIRRGGTVPVPKSHPIVAEISALLETVPEANCQILHADGIRRLGLRSDRRLPNDVREQIFQRGEIYGIEVTFLPPRAPTLGGEGTLRTGGSSGDPEPSDLVEDS